MGCWSTPSCHPELVSEAQNDAIQNPTPAFVARYARTTASSPARGEDKKVNAPKAVTTIQPFNFSTFKPRKQVAFTLAEVLITLAIIGIVAALTIPTLISSYNKKVIETRLLKFYSNMNNAIALSEIENGDKKYWNYSNSSCATGANGYDEPSLTEFFNTYLKPYLRYTKAEYKNRYLIVYFLDGSAVHIGYYGHDYRFYPVANKGDIAGKDIFLFGLYPSGANGNRNKYFLNKGVEPYICDIWDGEEKNLISDSCKAYSKVIQLNNWKIPDNYPVKL